MSEAMEIAPCPFCGKRRCDCARDWPEEER